MGVYYTGVGSRETPPDMLDFMARLAAWLAARGHVLRSGGAPGADTAFEQGAAGSSVIYLPWPGFNGRSRGVGLPRPSPEAYPLAAAVHPAWGRLSDAAKALHARNCHQVLGTDLRTPSAFLLCWTADGCDSEATRARSTGGTATAIVLACRQGVPVFNLGKPGAYDAFREFGACFL
jgi:hypothetical protein